MLPGARHKKGWASLKTENARQIALCVTGQWKFRGEIVAETGISSRSMDWYLDRMGRTGVVMVEKVENQHPINRHSRPLVRRYRLKGT